MLATAGAAGLMQTPACISEGPRRTVTGWIPGPGDLPVATPEQVGLESSAIDTLFEAVSDFDSYPNIRSLLVSRSDKLVAECYFADASDRDRPRSIMSATKSVTSLIAGVAVARGEVDSLDVTVGDVFPYLHPEKKQASIRLRDMLTMRAGIDYPNRSFSLDMEWGDARDSVACILSKPMRSIPGTTFDYTDACAHLAGATLSSLVGRPLQDYAAEHIFSPAGIRQSRWLRHADGRNYGAYGLFLPPRDLLRLGHFVRAARDGRSPSISADWMKQSTMRHVQPPDHDIFGYGYFWWTSPSGDAFTAAGQGGQYVYCIPAEELVIVVTADQNSQVPQVAVSHRKMQLIADMLLGRA